VERRACESRLSHDQCDRGDDHCTGEAPHPPSSSAPRAEG
jgi:hypothetical protein